MYRSVCLDGTSVTTDDSSSGAWRMCSAFSCLLRSLPRDGLGRGAALGLTSRAAMTDGYRWSLNWVDVQTVRIPRVGGDIMSIVTKDDSKYLDRFQVSKRSHANARRPSGPSCPLARRSKAARFSHVVLSMYGKTAGIRRFSQQVSACIVRNGSCSSSSLA